MPPFSVSATRSVPARSAMRTAISMMRTCACHAPFLTTQFSAP